MFGVLLLVYFVFGMLGLAWIFVLFCVDVCLLVLILGVLIINLNLFVLI